MTRYYLYLRRVAAALGKETGSEQIADDSAVLAAGKFVCTLEPTRSRITGDATRSIDLDWSAEGCVNGRTQYGFANGQWARVFVPNEEDVVSVARYDPQSRTYQADRYLLSRSAIAAARKVVYAASAEQRRNVNGVPDGEPAHPRPLIDPGPCKDSEIVRAVIHPAIGVMRVGDSPSDYFIGPEVPTPLNKPAGFYRDAEGRLKRQAARFRIYGYNAAGALVRELTAADSDIRWTAHLANRRPQCPRPLT